MLKQFQRLTPLVALVFFVWPGFVLAGDDEFLDRSEQLINYERAKRHIHALAGSADLNAIANQKASDMELNNYFDHINPKGMTAKDLIKQKDLNYSLVGENLARGFDTPEEMVGAWMKSPTHKANLLDERFGVFGLATAGDLSVLILADGEGASAPRNYKKSGVLSRGFNLNLPNFVIYPAIFLVVVLVGIDVLLAEKIHLEDADPLYLNHQD